MRKNNTDIRKAIKDAELKMYMVAHEYGVNDGNFSRLLRFELNTEQKEAVYAAIEKAKEKFKGE